MDFKNKTDVKRGIGTKSEYMVITENANGTRIRISIHADAMPDLGLKERDTMAIGYDHRTGTIGMIHDELGYTVTRTGGGSRYEMTYPRELTPQIIIPDGGLEIDKEDIASAQMTLIRII